MHMLFCFQPWYLDGSKLNINRYEIILCQDAKYGHFKYFLDVVLPCIAILLPLHALCWPCYYLYVYLYIFFFMMPVLFYFLFNLFYSYILLSTDTVCNVMWQIKTLDYSEVSGQKNGL